MDNKVVLYKSRGEVVGGETLFWRMRGERGRGLGIWPSFLGNIHNPDDYSSQTFLVLLDSFVFLHSPLLYSSA